MPKDTAVQRALRDIKAGVRDVAKSSPVIAAGDAIAKVGDFATEHAPKVVEAAKQAARRLRRGLTQGQRIRKNQATRRKVRRMRDGT